MVKLVATKYVGVVATRAAGGYPDVPRVGLWCVP